MSSRDTEKTLRELQKFMQEHENEITDDESVDRLTAAFMAQHNSRLESENTEPENAYDYLELADAAGSKKKRMEYLHKAVEVEPENMDAQLALLMTEHEDKPNEQLPELRRLMEMEEKQLDEEGVFEECQGDFWVCIETRPYMRLCHTYFEALIRCGMIRCAINEGERMLKLCEGDNLGVRYQLMHLYAYIEDEMHALALHKKYGGDEETQMLLPLAILYYKQNQFDKAEDYVNRLAKTNKGAKKFLRLAAKNDRRSLFMEQGLYGYQPDTIEELVEEYLTSPYLFVTTPYFCQWAYQYLRAQTAAKKKKPEPEK